MGTFPDLHNNVIDGSLPCLEDGHILSSPGEVIGARVESGVTFPVAVYVSEQEIRTRDQQFDAIRTDCESTFGLIGSSSDDLQLKSQSKILFKSPISLGTK